MRDPYEVLGVPRNAGEDEIKKAYRQLSRIYHPDANVNNPDKDQAEEKFKEIQQAYQAVMDEREHGYSGAYGSAGSGYAGSGGNGREGTWNSSFGGFGPFGGFGGFGAGNGSFAEEDQYLRAAANYINNAHFAEAIRVLGDIADRTAKWYYYSAIANSGAGNNLTALDHARTASAMEPDNLQYRSLAQSLEGGGSWYRSAGEQFGSPLMNADPCSGLCLANMLCCLCPGGFCCC